MKILMKEIVLDHLSCKTTVCYFQSVQTSICDLFLGQFGKAFFFLPLIVERFTGNEIAQSVQTLSLTSNLHKIGRSPILIPFYSLLPLIRPRYYVAGVASKCASESIPIPFE